MSIRNILRVGKSVSVFSANRFGSHLSVLDFLHLGATLSLRCCSRIASSISILGVTRIASSVSVFDIAQLGSSLSLRTFARLGASLSVIDFLKLGSTMSMRSFGRLGDTVSVFGRTRFGSSLSVFDFFHLGSSLSVRNFMRVGSYVSVTEVVVDSDLLFLNSAKNTYFKTGTNKLELTVGGTLTATFENDGGMLHGSWNVESSMVTSDRRLKRDIVPLQKTLRDVIYPRASTEKEPKATIRQVDAEAPTSTMRTSLGIGRGGATEKSDGALWLLRQLRPVSYSFRKGMDSKFMRFGFIADELDSVIPEVVRRPGDREVSDQKAVVYQDLIALLAAAAQSQQQVIEQQQRVIAENTARLDRLQQSTDLQKLEFELLRAELERLKKAKQEDEEVAKKRKQRRRRLRQKDKQQA